ncbi:MAG TPA: antibiotic biosynthesis monooxygenase [Thermoleophilaceae bacterium]|jgi:heme-degrading monooxygenase HmoA|nr:antibiotic biosynthesis monooxygenase [Thermoleophilaceae bacterium]
MFARVSTYEIPANRLADAARKFQGAVEEIQEIDGFREAYVLVDSEDGRALTMTVWDSRYAVETSRDAASRLRRTAARDSDGSIVSVVEYEVAAHI